MSDKYVSHQNNQGDATEHGSGTLGDPYNLIQSGLDNIGSGDTCHIKNDGSYVLDDEDQPMNTLLMSSGGGAGAFKTIEGYTTTPGDGGMVTIDGDNGDLDLFEIDRLAGGNIRIRNLYAYNAGPTGSRIGFFIDGYTSSLSNIIFENCKASHNGYGWKTNDFSTSYPVTGVQLINCESFANKYSNFHFQLYHPSTFINCMAYGTSAVQTSTNWRVRAATLINCLSYKGTAAMVYDGLWSEGEPALIINCNFANHWYGIRATASTSRVQVLSSILTDSVQRNFNGVGGSSIFGDYNCSYNGAYSDLGYIGGAHDISVDPQYSGASGIDYFKLKPGSPCLNTGMPTIANGFNSRGTWQQRQGLWVPKMGVIA